MPAWGQMTWSLVYKRQAEINTSAKARTLRDASSEESGLETRIPHSLRTVTAKLVLPGALNRKKSPVKKRSSRPKPYVAGVSGFPQLEFPSWEINVKIGSRPAKLMGYQEEEVQDCSGRMCPRATAFSQQNIIPFEAAPKIKKKIANHIRKWCAVSESQQTEQTSLAF